MGNARKGFPGSRIAASLLGVLAWCSTAAGAEPDVAPDGKPAAARDLPASYYAEMAEVKHRYGLSVEAVQLYRQAVQLAADAQQRLQYQLGLADALMAGGQKADALALWDELARSADPAASSAAALRLATRLVEEGRTDEAVKRLETLAVQSPIQLYRDSALRHLSKLLASSGAKAAKLEQYKKRLEAAPSDKSLLRLVLALQADDKPACVATLAAVAKASPRDIEVMRMYGAALVDAGRQEQAAKFYGELARDYPSEAQGAAEQLARIAVARGATADAEAKLVEAAARVPEGVRRPLYLARQCLALGLSAPAEKYARQAATQADGEAMKAAAAIELGEALYNLKRYPEAKAVLQPLADQTLWRGLQERSRRILTLIEGQAAAPAPKQD